MPTRCFKIKLKDGAEKEAIAWAAELHRRSKEVHECLNAEAMRLEAAFLDRQPDGVYLVYVLNADNFEKAREVTQTNPAPIEAFHQSFKKHWQSQQQLEPLIDFLCESETLELN